MNQYSALATFQGRILDDFCGSSGNAGDVEDFIRTVYAQRFSAMLDSFLPNLVATRNDSGSVTAAAGYQCAAAGSLFLENYLEQPIETVIRVRYGETVDRRRIVEVGNLATYGNKAAITLIASLIPYLLSWGFTWVAFTGNDAVRNLFKRLHLLPFAICPANKAALGEARHAWGSYYEHHPIVMAGRLNDGASAITVPTRAR
ncbi:MAG TPA: thermostable hemolysin [Gammaproteobacteria bacterium]|nr:thermostable hemolysin [Gammaproteobacteria bacterium]